MKKKILILGATGMLGRAVYSVLKDKYNLVLTVRDLQKLKHLDKTHGDVKKHKTVEVDVEKIWQDFKDKKGSPSPYLTEKLKEIGEVDGVVNCIGLVIAPSNENPQLAFFVNGALPHILAREFGSKMIHITTDCVFNGLSGFPYDENSPKTPVDIYGLSKSLGEPTNCLTLRTSIIGRELETYSGILEWFLHQKEPVVTGFANHFWNGVTTIQFAKICDQIFSNRSKFPKSGIFHIFSNVISKYDMLVAFKKKYNLKVETQKDTNRVLHRELKSIYTLNSLLEIPRFERQIDLLS